MNAPTPPADFDLLQAARAHAAQQAQKIAELEHDVFVLALRLYSEDESTFAIETANVMARWRPRCAAEFGLAESGDIYDYEPSDEAMEACTWKTKALVGVDRESA